MRHDRKRNRNISVELVSNKNITQLDTNNTPYMDIQ